MKDKTQIDIFNELWEEKEHVSFVKDSNGNPMPLHEKGHNLWHWQFAHVLNKGSHGKAKLSKENIVFLTPLQHGLFDHAPHKVKNLPEWKGLFELRQELKAKYHQGYFDN